MVTTLLVSIRHNFETAHRLPFLEGKCQSIHGHSWEVEFIFDYPLDTNGLSLEFGNLKAVLRGWVDTYLDHGTMLGQDDTLLSAFMQENSKVFIFGSHPFAMRYPWPTVEATAGMLATMAARKMGIEPFMVKVQEGKSGNMAGWGVDDGFTGR